MDNEGRGMGVYILHIFLFLEEKREGRTALPGDRGKPLPAYQTASTSHTGFESYGLRLIAKVDLP